VLQDIDTENGIPFRAGFHEIDNAFYQFVARKMRAVLLAKAVIWLHCQEPIRGFKLQQVAGHLSDAGSDLNHVAFEIRSKFVDQCLPIIPRLIEGSELEVIGVGG